MRGRCGFVRENGESWGWVLTMLIGENIDDVGVHLQETKGK